jgi:hypothetical protein
MYAPFQALFLWYAYFQLNHLLDNDRSARTSCLLLSALSIFVYAGSAMLLVLNFLPLLWPGKRWNSRYLVSSLGLLAFGFYYYRIDFRFLGIPEDQLPPPPTIDDTAMSAASALPLPIDLPYLPEPALAVLVLGTIAFVLLSWSLRGNLRLNHPSFLLWGIAMAAVCFGLIAFGLALILVAALAQAPSPLRKGARLTAQLVRVYIVGVIILTSLVFLTFTLAERDFMVATKQALNYLFNYPNVYYKVARPWFQAIPITTSVMSALLIPLLWIILRPRSKPSEQFTPIRYLFTILAILLLLVGLLNQPYHISRYTYFLYPVILLLASASFVWLAQRVGGRFPRNVQGIIVGGLALLLLTEDFGAEHLLGINEPDVRYRLRYGENLAGHFYKRWDFRGSAQFVNDRLDAHDRVLVFHQPLPRYLDRTDGIFLRRGSTNHSLVWGCGGTKDLWSNAPLLDEDHEVFGIIQQSQAATWLIMHTPHYRWRDPLEDRLVEQFRLQPEHTSIDGNLAVYRVSGRSGQEIKLQE